MHQAMAAGDGASRPTAPQRAGGRSFRVQRFSSPLETASHGGICLVSGLQAGPV